MRFLCGLSCLYGPSLNFCGVLHVENEIKNWWRSEPQRFTSRQQNLWHNLRFCDSQQRLGVLGRRSVEQLCLETWFFWITLRSLLTSYLFPSRLIISFFSPARHEPGRSASVLWLVFKPPGVRSISWWPGSGLQGPLHCRVSGSVSHSAVVQVC